MESITKEKIIIKIITDIVIDTINSTKVKPFLLKIFIIYIFYYNKFIIYKKIKFQMIENKN
jgi:hypothetical protein